MEFRSLVWVCILIFLKTRPAIASWTPSQYCFFGCNDAAYQFPFKGPSDICANELFVKSVYYCAGVYCSDVEIRHGLHEAHRICDEEGVTLPNFESLVSPVNLTSIERVSLKGAKNLKKGLDYPVIPNPSFFEISRRTVVS